MENYISFADFDWKYYIDSSQDLKKIRNSRDAYNHWIQYGCFENRPVKNLKTKECFTVKLQKEKGERFSQIEQQKIDKKKEAIERSLSHQQQQQQRKIIPSQIHQRNPAPPKIKLSFKLAILLHIFDIEMFPNFYIHYLNKLTNKYDDDDVHIYINFVIEDNPYGNMNTIKSAVEEHITHILNKNVYYCFNENRGGDIGGFLILSKIILDKCKNESLNYKYILFAHTKKKDEWRKELVKPIFNYKFEYLSENSKMEDFGIIGAKKWIYNIEPRTPKEQQQMEKYKYHMIDLCNMYNLEEDVKTSWKFVAGTMFILDTRIVQYIIYGNEIKNENDDSIYVSDVLYYKLNKLDSIDVNWLNIVTDILKKDPKDVGNDLAYRMKYGKPLHPDHMIEHTFERVIGLICKHLGLKVYGI